MGNVAAVEDRKDGEKKSLKDTLLQKKAVFKIASQFADVSKQKDAKDDEKKKKKKKRKEKRRKEKEKERRRKKKKKKKYESSDEDDESDSESGLDSNSGDDDSEDDSESEEETKEWKEVKGKKSSFKKATAEILASHISPLNSGNSDSPQSAVNNNANTTIVIEKQESTVVPYKNEDQLSPLSLKQNLSSTTLPYSPPMNRKQSNVDAMGINLEIAQQTADLLFEFIPYCGLGDTVTDSIVMEALCGANINPDSRGSFGNTLLIVACQHSNLEVARVLLRIGANPSLQNTMGACALHFACYADSYNITIASLLLEYGARPDIVETTFGSTPLHYASGSPDSNLLLLLLNGGANVFIKDFSGYNALDYAKQAGLQENCRMLLGRMGLSETEAASWDNLYYHEEKGLNQSFEKSSRDLGKLTSTNTSDIAITSINPVNKIFAVNKTLSPRSIEKEMTLALKQANNNNKKPIVPSVDELHAEIAGSKIKEKLSSSIQTFLKENEKAEDVIVEELLVQWRNSAFIEGTQNAVNKMRESIASQSNESHEQLSSVSKKVTELENDKNKLEKQIHDFENEGKNLKKQLASKDEDITRLNNEKINLISSKENELNAVKSKFEIALLNQSNMGASEKQKLNELMTKIHTLQDSLSASQAQETKLKQQLQDEEKKAQTFKKEQQEKENGLTIRMKELEATADGALKKSHELEKENEIVKKNSIKEIEESKSIRLMAIATQNEAKKIKDEGERQFKLSEEARLQNEQMRNDLLMMKKDKAVLENDLLKEQQARKRLHNELEDMKGKIRVICRVRPFSSSEKEKNCLDCTELLPPDTVIVNDKGKGNPFEFDGVFGPSSKQSQIFEGPKKLIQTAIDGFNVCIFAYGQTGSGKTFTMTGVQGDADLQGITPRAVDEIFNIKERDATKYSMKITLNMFELYKSSLQDLLLNDKEKKDPPKLVIKRDDKGIVHVEGANKREIATKEDLHEALNFGYAKRKTQATKMNSESSRSHLMQMILIECTNSRTGVVSFGKLTLVDLAGCERASKTGATGDTLKEAISINQGLSALGELIGALTSGAKHLPYRNHLLTELMSDSLGGTAKTLMFVNISPADYNSNESKNSLQFASRCRAVTNNVTSNKAAPESNSKQVLQMKAELERLKNSNIATKAAPVLVHGASPIHREGAPEGFNSDEIFGQEEQEEEGVVLKEKKEDEDDEDVNKIVDDALKEEEDRKIDIKKEEPITVVAVKNNTVIPTKPTNILPPKGGKKK